MPYALIYFSQGEEAAADLAIIDEVGPVDFGRLTLPEAHRPGAHPLVDDAPWGSEDQVYALGQGFYLSINPRIGTVGLCRQR